jgi:hypothetical protein
MHGPLNVKFDIFMSSSGSLHLRLGKLHKFSNLARRWYKPPDDDKKVSKHVRV